MRGTEAPGALIAFLLLATLVAGPLRGQDIGLPIGTVPEAVTIEDLDGNPVDLGTWIGEKPMLVEFWATWCPVCEALFPRIERAAQQFGDSVAIVVVAVGVNQSPRSIRRYLERHPMPFATVLWDGRGRATRAFAAFTTSYVVALDGSGKVVYTGSGEDQDIEGAMRKALGS